jgi:uncharacterized protein YecA (UPF0149 family)
MSTFTGREEFRLPGSKIKAQRSEKLRTFPHQVRTVVRDTVKTGRNDPCHCGSGKKFKKCCERVS